jgi:hypothetical protein
MAKSLDDLLRERPGDPDAQVRHRSRMVNALRRHQLRELRAIWRLKPVDPEVDRRD